MSFVPSPSLASSPVPSSSAEEMLSSSPLSVAHRKRPSPTSSLTNGGRLALHTAEYDEEAERINSIDKKQRFDWSWKRDSPTLLPALPTADGVQTGLDEEAALDAQASPSSASITPASSSRSSSGDLASPLIAAFSSPMIGPTNPAAAPTTNSGVTPSAVAMAAVAANAANASDISRALATPAAHVLQSAQFPLAPTISSTSASSAIDSASTSTHAHASPSISALNSATAYAPTNLPSSSASAVVVVGGDGGTSPVALATMRVKVACSNCKTSKTKCDNSRPCGRCVRTDRAATCADPVVTHSHARSHATEEEEDVMDTDESIHSPGAASQMQHFHAAMAHALDHTTNGNTATTAVQGNHTQQQQQLQLQNGVPAQGGFTNNNSSFRLPGSFPVAAASASQPFSATVNSNSNSAPRGNGAGAGVDLSPAMLKLIQNQWRHQTQHSELLTQQPTTNGGPPGSVYQNRPPVAPRPVAVGVTGLVQSRHNTPGPDRVLSPSGAAATTGSGVTVANNIPSFLSSSFNVASLREPPLSPRAQQWLTTFLDVFLHQLQSWHQRMAEDQAFEGNTNSTTSGGSSSHAQSMVRRAKFFADILLAHVHAMAPGADAVLLTADISNAMQSDKDVYSALNVGVLSLSLGPGSALLARPAWVNQSLTALLGYSDPFSLESQFTHLEGLALLYPHTNLRVAVPAFMDAVFTGQANYAVQTEWRTRDDRALQMLESVNLHYDSDGGVCRTTALLYSLPNAANTSTSPMLITAACGPTVRHPISNEPVTSNPPLALNPVDPRRGTIRNSAGVNSLVNGINPHTGAASNNNNNANNTNMQQMQLQQQKQQHHHQQRQMQQLRQL